MSIDCEMTLRRTATAAQLAELGRALWGWLLRGARETSMGDQLDNQTLADLIAGQLPVAGVFFRFRDESSADRQATLDSLRRQLPAGGVADILVAGKSWNAIADPEAASALPSAVRPPCRSAS